MQHVVSSYERHYATLQSPLESGQTDSDSRGKECSNLIVLLSELYNFQVISCILLYDIIRSLLNADLDEFRVELLLKLLRSRCIELLNLNELLMYRLDSGQQLRQDDPAALKDIVQVVQGKTSGSQEFMR